MLYIFYSVLFLLFYIVHRMKKSILFLQKEGPLKGCRILGTSESVMVAYTHKYAKELGMHLVTYLNCDTVPFLLLVQ